LANTPRSLTQGFTLCYYMAAFQALQRTKKGLRITTAALYTLSIQDLEG